MLPNAIETLRDLVASVCAGTASQEPGYHLVELNCESHANLVTGGIQASHQIIEIVYPLATVASHSVCDGSLDPILHILVPGIASSAVAGTGDAVSM